MRFIIALFLFVNIARIRCHDECGDINLQEHVYGDCDKVTKDQRVIYSKMCINEYDERNYTIGWAGQEEITCIRINTNGKVFIITGGIGETLAAIFVESTTGKELEWVNDIFVKK